MKSYVLTQNEITPRGATHAFDVGHLDLTETTVDTPQAVPLITLGAGYLVEVIYGELIEAFQDTADAAFNSTTVSAGIAGALVGQLAATQVNAKDTPVQATVGTGAVLAPTAATALVANFVGLPDTKALASLNKGLYRIWVKITDARG